MTSSTVHFRPNLHRRLESICHVILQTRRRRTNNQQSQDSAPESTITPESGRLVSFCKQVKRCSHLQSGGHIRMMVYGVSQEGDDLSKTNMYFFTCSKSMYVVADAGKIEGTLPSKTNSPAKLCTLSTASRFWSCTDVNG